MECASLNGWRLNRVEASICASCGRALICAVSTAFHGALQIAKEAPSSASSRKSSSRVCDAIKRKRCAAISCNRGSSTAIFRLPDSATTSFSTTRATRKEIARMSFPRQIGGEHLCLADYLREPREGGASDVVAMQIVTVGSNVTRRTEALQASGDYSESYFLHGFSVQAAEALAEHTHRRIRSELGLESQQGKRYSWGYGACPDLEQHGPSFGFSMRLKTSE